MPPDYYEILGVLRNASREEIKKAYLQAAQRLHPDKNKVAGETEIFLDIKQAYETLSNQKLRKKYDSTLPTDKQSNLPIRLKTYYSRPNLLRSDEPQLIYVLLEISPHKNVGEITAPPLNICLVLDRSTSMQGDKMEMLKGAAIKVMRNLRQQDVISMITFSDRAEVVIPATSSYEINRLENRIHMLNPSGSTEIFQGLQAAFDEIKKNSNKDYVDHIILITDGRTYGDEKECLKLAEQASQLGIGISTMGIGKEWNDEFLDTLAKQTGGSSRYISRPEEIQRFLIDKFESLSQTIADNVILEIKIHTGVKMTYAFRTQPETGPLPLKDSIHLGPVLQDTTLNLLFEFRIDPSLTIQDSLTLTQGLLKLNIAARPTPIQPIPIEFSSAIKDEVGNEMPSQLIIQALGKLTLYRMQEKAHRAVEQGNFELASQQMKQLATSLIAWGEQDLANTAFIEAKNIQNERTISGEGSKAIKYGTRALIMAKD
ncbi:MAG: VWA domain-containing protein [Anaerolineae bacterium]|nr:VWA domain-containing protein [Anaerolineae bacterium]MDK1079850.1 VWA domain-containing protein [Anaerolineae bacterium]